MDERAMLFNMRTLVALLGAGMLWGCGPSLPDKIGFAGQSATLQSGTQVNFQDAWVEEDLFKVKVWVANLSPAFMNVSRDGWALRLPDGRVLRRAVGTFTTHNLYSLPPGGGHEVFVDFRDPGNDMRHIPTASLIVGGISFSTDPRERVVGEIPLVPSGPRD
jgi:hypothetical protein